MKGWIEVTRNVTGLKYMINIRNIEAIVDINIACEIWLTSPDTSIHVKESYEQIKKLIEDATI